MTKETDWQSQLSPEQFQVCRLGHTEKPFTGKHLNNKADGQYYCICCKEVLFASKDKFDSSTGWPSFFDAKDRAVQEIEDRSLSMLRTEIKCAKCQSHLGHVFNDGPEPTGLRYCVNSIALEFEPQNKP